MSTDYDTENYYYEEPQDFGNCAYCGEVLTEESNYCGKSCISLLKSFASSSNPHSTVTARIFSQS